MSPRSQSCADLIDDESQPQQHRPLCHCVSSESLYDHGLEKEAHSHHDDDHAAVTTTPKQIALDNVSANGTDSLHHPLLLESQPPQRRRRTLHAVPVTTLLPILVLIDMLAVSLVVPLLTQYYKNAGVSSAAERELLSSVYSSSQIVGGLVFGLWADAGRLQRRTILLISYAGSLVSYGMLVLPETSFATIVASRILVGLVKQSTTVSISVLSAVVTDRSTRAVHLGRLSSASTAAWIIGPSIGALLHRYVGPGAPCFVACVLFGINIVLTLCCLNNEEMCGNKSTGTTTNSSGSSSHVPTTSVPRQLSWSVWSNLQTCFSSRALGSVVVASLLVTWVTRATNYSQLGNFYEDMYGLEPHVRGYIYSYQQALQFLVQSLLVDRILRVTGSERRSPAIPLVILFGTVSLDFSLVCHYQCHAAIARDARGPSLGHVFSPGRLGCLAKRRVGDCALLSHGLVSMATLSVRATVRIIVVVCAAAWRSRSSGVGALVRRALDCGLFVHCRLAALQSIQRQS
jgi:MFS family permease